MLFISSIEALSHLVASNSKEPILIGGELVLLSHDKASAADIGSLTDRYIAQPPRMASRKSILDKGKKNLYVSIDKQAIEMILAYKGPVALSADQYLAYGLSKKKNVIVVGGGESSVEGNVSLEGFVFTDQCLVDTFEKSSPFSGYMFEIVLKDILREYPSHEIHWCSPLEAMPDCDIKSSPLFVDAGDAALKHLVKRKVFSRKQSEEEGWGLLPAISVALFGFLILAGGAGYQWKRLEAERAEYLADVSGYETAYQNSSHSLELLRHRDFLLSSDSESLSNVELLNTLISTVANIDDVLIKHIKVIDTKSPDYYVGDEAFSDLFVLDIAVPKNEVLGGARQQAESIVKRLNQQLGMTVRVISHSTSGDGLANADQEYWSYTFGGSK